MSSEFWKKASLLKTAPLALAISLVPAQLCGQQPSEINDTTREVQQAILDLFECPQDSLSPDSQRNILIVDYYYSQYGLTARAVPEKCDPVFSSSPEILQQALDEAKAFLEPKGIVIRRQIKFEPMSGSWGTPAQTSHHSSYSTIHFLEGLPYDFLIGALVHELFHVWRVENRKYSGRQPGDLEEGSCQYVGWLYFKENEQQYWQDLTQGTQEGYSAHEAGLRKILELIGDDVSFESFLYAITRSKNWDQFKTNLEAFSKK